MTPISLQAGLLRWGNREGVRRLAAVRDLDSGRLHIYGGKNQISNLAFIYTCAEMLLFLYET